MLSFMFLLFFSASEWYCFNGAALKLFCEQRGSLQDASLARPGSPRLLLYFGPELRTLRTEMRKFGEVRVHVGREV